MASYEELAALLGRLESAAGKVSGVSCAPPPVQRVKEPLRAYLRRHEREHRQVVAERLMDWLDGKELTPQDASAPHAIWLRARLEFAFALAKAMAAPLAGGGGSYLPLNDADQLDKDWPSWLLLEAWDFAGAEQWLRITELMFDPWCRFPGFDSGAE